jgi:predicted metal-dependent hydrolase
LGNALSSRLVYPDQQYTAEQICAACRGALHPQARVGLRLFNRGEYFEAHEALELAWRDERGAVREMYRGVLQIGVAYFHILNQNYSGAMKMFTRAKPWLAPFPSPCRGVDLASLKRDAAQIETIVQQLGAARMHHFNPALLNPIQYEQEPP